MTSDAEYREAITGKWTAKFHGFVSNKTIEGGLIAMYIVFDPADGKNVVSLGAHPDYAQGLVQNVVDTHNGTPVDVALSRAAMSEARGLISVMLKSPLVKAWDQRQRDAFQDVLSKLRVAMGDKS